MSWVLPARSCDECKRSSVPLHELRVSRRGSGDYYCVDCGARKLLRWSRMGLNNLIAPEAIHARARELEATITIPPRQASEPWLSHDQSEFILRQEAQATAARLGHQLGAWGIIAAFCSRCNEAVYVQPREMWVASIRGECVSMECAGRPRVARTIGDMRVS